MSKNSKNILIAEDDADIAMMIKVVLEYHQYSAVIAVPEKEKIIESLSSHNFDLLIIDMLLSGVNGLDICAYIKKDELLSQIPVLMISAHPNASELSKAAAADDFIAKPFDLENLCTKVETLLR